MVKKFPFIIAAGLGIAGCAETTTTEADPLTTALAGKTLVGEVARIDVHADGTLSGAVGPDLNIPVEGAWEIRNGQWCRTFTTAPEALMGTSCQEARLNDDGTLWVSGVNGPSTFEII